jgi:hypothetical protein
MFTTRVLRQATVVLLFIIVCGVTARAQDPVSTSSLYKRLKSVTNIGLSVDERLGGFTIHVYSPEEQAKNTESLAKYRADLSSFNDAIAAIDKRRGESQSKGATVDVLNAITQERNNAQSSRPASPFGDGRIALHRIVEVAVDYIEIEPLDDSENTILIPFHKICRIIKKKPSATPSLGSANKK